MAVNKQLPTGRQSIFLPFGSGVQDDFLGYVKNGVLNKTKDENAKEQAYYTLRPSFAAVENTASGTFMAASEFAIATNSNLYFKYRTQTGTAYAPAYYAGTTNATNYAALFGTQATQVRPSILSHNYTGNNQSFEMLASQEASQIFIVESSYLDKDAMASPTWFDLSGSYWTYSGSVSVSTRTVTIAEGGSLGSKNETASTANRTYTAYVTLKGTGTIHAGLGNSGTDASTSTQYTLTGTTQVLTITRTFDSTAGTIHFFFVRNTGDTCSTFDLTSVEIYSSWESTSTNSLGTIQTLSFPPCPYMASLDGYLFVAQAGTDTIFNSAVNDYTSWDTSVNLIRASQYPGVILALTRINNYVVALKDSSIEFFYDAGLTDTSPLQRNTSYTKMVGLSCASSLVSVNNTCFFIGADATGGRKIYQLTETNCSPISTKKIDSIISTWQTDVYSGYTYGYYLSVGDKRFYCLTNTDTSDGVLVYDIGESIWYIWSGAVVECIRYATSTSVYNGAVVTFGDTPGAVNPVCTTFNCFYGNANQYTKDDYLQVPHISLHPVVYVPIQFEATVPPVDINNGNRKFINELSISCFSPADMQHQLTVNKLMGGNNTVTVVQGTNKNNLNFKNWGQAVLFQITYDFYDPTDQYTIGVAAGGFRSYGIQCDYTMGIS